ncbi:MAG TPA: hypothetical protein VMW83_12615 [Spirochaetia bacterium]|nr:hypothetical protein [Spirochaetia bacterium]
MFPQTHLYFAARILDRMSDAIALGSVFPDMIITSEVTWNDTHCRGAELYRYLCRESQLRDFSLAAVTHGAAPAGLDFYGDKSYPPYNHGFCFEKARPLVEKTIIACRVPEEMGWWKAHNILEMGIELSFGASGRWGQALQRGFANDELIGRLAERLTRFFPLPAGEFIRRMRDYPCLVELSAATAGSLAEKYAVQMMRKHGIEIDIPAVAELIELAGATVAPDLDGFFLFTERRVAAVLKDLSQV